MTQTFTEQWREMVLKPLDGDQQVAGPHQRLEGLDLRQGGPSLRDLQAMRRGGTVVQLDGIDRTLLQEAAEKAE